MLTPCPRTWASSACRPCTSSEYLVDLVNRSVRASFANTDGDDAIQECVFFRRGLEPRHGAKVVAGGIDGFAAGERRDHIRRAMAQPLKRHIDQRVVVRLQRDAQV